MTASFGDMTDENSESAETRCSENHVRIKTPDGHSPGTDKCVQVQCTTTGNECSPNDGPMIGCATPAAGTDAVDADTDEADGAEASGVEIEQNGEMDGCGWMEAEPFDKEEDWETEIEGAYASGRTVDTKDDDAESEDWETEIVKPCYIMPNHPYLFGKKVFLPADIHATSVQWRTPSFHAVEGQFDDADDSDT